MSHAVVVGVFCLFSPTRASGEAPSDTPSVAGTTAQSPVSAEQAATNEESAPADSLVPLPTNAVFKRHQVVAGTRVSVVVGGDSSKTASGRSASKLVYSNTLGAFVFGPSPGVRVADDITTVAADGCVLDKFVFRVTGDRNNNPDLDEGPFTVDYALFETCPNAKICQPWETICPRPIGGTSGSVRLPDEGFHEVIVNIPELVCAGGINDGQACTTDVDCQPLCVGGDSDGSPCTDSSDCPGGVCDPQLVGACNTEVPLPSSFYLALTFSRPQAGIVVGAPALLGVSADRYDGPFACATAFGGFPARAHASFYAEVYVRDDCPAAFPGYHNSLQSGRSFSAGPGRFFADDIRLGVDECNMVGYEARFKGERSTSQGLVEIKLHTLLDPADPDGGAISGTRSLKQIFGTDVQVLRRGFSTPIPLSARQELWAVYRTSARVLGPIKTCKRATIGNTEDRYMEYVGTAPNGMWQPFDLGGNCHSAFDLTIYCEGEPPPGACCDILLQEGKTCIGGSNDGDPCNQNGACDSRTCVGEAVCREVAQWNCPTTSPERWEEGGRCGPVCVGGENNDQHCQADADCPNGSCEGSFCVGGLNDGQACARLADCPGGDCVGGPFRHACGFGGCCTLDDQCLDTTHRECMSLPGEQRGMLFFWNKSCESGLWECPFGACLTREGGCTYSRPGRGCEDPQCCTDVCDFDSFCCTVAWDDLCVAWSDSLCPQIPFNDTCVDPIRDRGAIPVAVGEHVVVSNAHSSFQSSELDFCCPGAPAAVEGVAKVWFRFEAPEPSDPSDDTVSVEVSTCGTSSLPGDTASDTLIRVFEVRDSDRGRCADGFMCSVEFQDCLDGSMCEFDQEAACGSLTTIACNDDAEEACIGPNRIPEPAYARLCLPNLTPGNIYYAMVGSKTMDDRGLLQFSVTSPCDEVPLPTIPNDMCENAIPITDLNVRIPFDLSGGGVNAQATGDCSAPTCVTDLSSDLWYDWTAPSDGVVTLRAHYAGDYPETRTGLVIYEGCDCPVGTANELACFEGFGWPCSEASVIQQGIVADTCYKIRLAGQLSGQPKGELSFHFEPLGEAIAFLDPPGGIVDARQPHPPTDPNTVQILDRLKILSPNGTPRVDQWAVCELFVFDPNVPVEIEEIVNHCDGTYTLVMDRPILTAHPLWVRYSDVHGVAKAVRFVAQPGDVNADRVTSAADITSLLEILRGTTTSASGIFSEDVDRSGTLGPADVLRLIDLLKGAEAYQVWLGTTTFPDTDPCP